MKICKLTNGLLVSLLFVSVAEADSKYPATDFQPKVVYQDTEYKHNKSSSSSSASKSNSGEKSTADSAYPAANFEPEVLFSDDDYVHTKDKVVAYSGKSGKPTSSVSASENSSTDSVEAESGDSSLDLIIGLALLAIAGFVFYSKNKPKGSVTKEKRPVKKAKVAKKKSLFSKKTTKKPVRKASVAVASNSGSSDGSSSGVAKYLESKAGVEPSSVEKYLDERKTDTSSVAKYVAKQKISARVASVTGVEKYLKDKS